MSSKEILSELQETNKLKQLVIDGHVSPTVARNLEMYFKVDAEMKTGKGKHIAVCLTAACFNVEPNAVYVALRKFK